MKKYITYLKLYVQRLLRTTEVPLSLENPCTVHIFYHDMGSADQKFENYNMNLLYNLVKLNKIPFMM